MESLEPLSPVDPAARPFPGLFTSPQSPAAKPDPASRDAAATPAARQFSQDLATARQPGPAAAPGQSAKNPAPASPATDSGATSRDVLSEWTTVARQTGFAIPAAAGAAIEGSETGIPGSVVSQVVASSPANSAGTGADEPGAESDTASSSVAPPAWLLAMFPGLTAATPPSDQSAVVGADATGDADGTAASVAPPVPGADVPTAPELVKAFYATTQGGPAGKPGDRNRLSLPMAGSKGAPVNTGESGVTGTTVPTLSPGLPQLADVAPVAESAGQDAGDSPAGDATPTAGLAGLVAAMSSTSSRFCAPVAMSVAGKNTDSVSPLSNLPAAGAAEVHSTDQSPERTPEAPSLAPAGPQAADSTPPDHVSRLSPAGWQQSGAVEAGAVAGAPQEATVSPWDRRQFADRLSDLVLQSHDAGQQMSVRVTPPDLGAIVINVQSGQDGLNIRLEASSSDTQQLLTDNLSHLQESLSQLGRPAERIDIVHGDGNYGSQFGFGSDQAGRFAQDSQRQAEPAWRPESVREPAETVTPEGPRSVTSGLPARMQELNIKV